jgi:hypothetical protein
MNLGSDERKWFGPITALVGLRLFEDFLPIQNLDEVAKALAHGLEPDDEPSLVRLIIVTLYKLLQRRELRSGQDVNLEIVAAGNELYLSPPTVLNKLTAHFRREPTDMPTSEDAMREALRIDHQQNGGQGIVKSMREGKRFGGTSGKAIVLNLDKVEEALGISVAQWQAAFSENQPKDWQFAA